MEVIERPSDWPDTHYSAHPDDPVLFYGGPFSNFVGGPFEILSEQPWTPEPVSGLYPTVEHFFQASKARNGDLHAYVTSAYGPGQAKGRGRMLELRDDWEDVKYDVMVHALRSKFEPGTEFFPYLLKTGERYIAEDSPTDFIWGVRDGDGGYTGLNLLGRALMQVREEFRERLRQDVAEAGALIAADDLDGLVAMMTRKQRGRDARQG